MSSFSSLLSSNSLENNQPIDMFEVDDFLAFTDEAEEEAPWHHPAAQHSAHVLQVNGCHEIQNKISEDCNKSKNAGRTPLKRSTSVKVAFKTKSELEMLDDGYKWRKYGKKMVKSSPHPRNYYRCSSEGCDVKKRVEREQEDSRFVITTYEGVHNHHALRPAIVQHQAFRTLLDSPDKHHQSSKTPGEII